jgi:hypothetical protein
MKPFKAINRVITYMVVLGALLCILAFGQLAWWAADRDAPFVMLDYNEVSARAGESTVIKAVVKRDLSRRCSVLFSRSFIDSKGTRFELTDGSQSMNSASLTALNQRTPDQLNIGVRVPVDAAPGVGTVMTTLDYECNPIHQIYPIPMVLNMNLEVLP